MKQKRARREAERYLWHLRTEWVARFDHDHWWIGKGNEIPIGAAVWEIIRRHPNAVCVHQRWNSDDEMNELQFSIGRDGLCSWPKLTAQQQNDFVRRIWKHLPSQHGYVIPPVTVLNDLRSLKKYMQSLKSKKDAKRLVELEERLARRLCAETLSFHRSGQIIVAIDPGAHPLRIAQSVKAAVQNLRGNTKQLASGKARNDQRLDVIANFEHAELSKKPSKANRNADLFTRYRRIIKSFAVPF